MVEKRKFLLLVAMQKNTKNGGPMLVSARLAWFQCPGRFSGGRCETDGLMSRGLCPRANSFHLWSPLEAFLRFDSPNHVENM